MSVQTRSKNDTRIEGYRVVHDGKSEDFTCPMCVHVREAGRLDLPFCLCAEAAWSAHLRAIRVGGRVRILRLPDLAVLARVDAPPRGASAKDWKGFLAADVDDEGPDDGPLDEPPGIDLEMSAAETRARVTDVVASEVGDDLEDEGIA